MGKVANPVRAVPEHPRQRHQPVPPVRQASDPVSPGVEVGRVDLPLCQGAWAVTSGGGAAGQVCRRSMKRVFEGNAMDAQAIAAEAPVLIAGGGLVGLSTAMFLSQHGIASLVVE